jgi:hypothetical protein
MALFLERNANFNSWMRAGVICYVILKLNWFKNRKREKKRSHRNSKLSLKILF